jgi:urease accessory protein
MAHSHDGGITFHHSHETAVDHGHTHEILDGPGSFQGREMPIIEGRDWSERAFTVGIGGYGNNAKIYRNTRAQC